MRIYRRVSEFLSGRSLASRAARGTLWMSAGGGIEQTARLLRNLILVRILTPEDFGVMAILVATNAAFESLTEVGVRQAVIQNPRGGEHEFLNAVWWFSWLRAASLYAFGFVLAPWLARFYAEPDLAPYLRYVFLWVLLHGTLSPKAYLALKRMRYAGWVAITQGAAVIGVATSLLMVLRAPGIMALMTGFVAEAAALSLISYALYPFAPNLRFDRTLVRQLTRYARGMAGVPILTFLFMRSEIFVVGKIFARDVLGLYNWVSNLARLPVQAASKLLAHLLLPAFSQIQQDPARLNRAMIHITAVFLGMGTTAAAFSLLYGRPFLLLVAGAPYGERYAAFNAVLALSAGTAVLRMLSVPVANAFFALARPDMHRRYAFMRAALLVITIYPATHFFGPTGAAAAVLLVSALSGIFHFATLARLTGLSLRRLAVETTAGLALAAPVVAVWLLTRAWTDGRPLLALAAGVAGCALSLAAGAWVWIRRVASHRAFAAPAAAGLNGE
ncbi:MAG: hypothetical protein FJ225_12580 [Lentisphaerae bacterium]|nr:hypothetical protein [Lentisphaerota bacterium]